MPDQTPIYTIGYGTRTVETFLAALRANGTAYLIDVRSQPYSRFKPEFSRTSLQVTLRGSGIQYLFMGDELGGRPRDPDCYSEDGKVDYAKCRLTEPFQSGLRRLRKAYDQHLVVVLMCSEGKPQGCHRSKLIGEALTEQQVPVVHIDENGNLKTQREVIGLVLRTQVGNVEQTSLFPETVTRTFTSRKKYRPNGGSEP